MIRDCQESKCESREKHNGTSDQNEMVFHRYSHLSKGAAQRNGSAAVAGLARLFLITASFLAKRACARAAKPLSAGAGVGHRLKTRLSVAIRPHAIINAFSLFRQGKQRTKRQSHHEKQQAKKDNQNRNDLPRTKNIK
jgi:hypothetical protein